MGVIMQWLRLFRVGNLMMIALTQYLAYYTIVVAILKASLFTPSLSKLDFFLLSFSTCIIAAAGYVINNYFDKDIDASNNRNSTPAISQKAKLVLFFVCSGIGIVIGCYLTYVSGLRQIAIINTLTAGLLYFYSASYKRIMLVGNFVVAFLTGVAVFLPAFADYELQYAFRDITLPPSNNAAYNLRIIVMLVGAYAAFAFLLTFVREIIKDMEDMEGDALHGCKTLPLVAGVRISKLIIQTIILTVLLLLAYVQWSQHQWENKITFGYTVMLVQLPLIILFGYLVFANEKKQFHVASLMSKVAMLLGVLSMPVFYYFAE